MKKFMKGCAIVALVMMVAGFVLAVVAGGKVGAKTISQVVDSVTDGNVSVNLNSFSDWGLTLKDNVIEQLGGFEVNAKYDINDSTMFESDYEILNGDVEKYCLGEKVKELRAQLGGCSLEVKTSSDEKIYLEVENAYKFQGYVEDETLYIKGSIGTSTWDELNDFKVILYLPADFAFEKADFELGAGLMVLKDIIAEEMRVEVGAGTVSVAGIEAEDAKFAVGAGQIQLSAMELGKLKVEVGMGEFVADGVLNGDADIECAMGNVELDVKGTQKDFNYKLEGAMGNIDLDDESYSGLATEQKISNNANKTMDVECAMGNISIRFQ